MMLSGWGMVLGASVVSGVVVFSAVTLTMGLMSGRPGGAERTLLIGLRRLIQRQPQYL